MEVSSSTDLHEVTCHPSIRALVARQVFPEHIYLVSDATVVLKDVVILASDSLSDLLCGGQEINHLSIGQLMQELGVVYFF